MTSADGAVRPEWIGRAPHHDLERGARPILPSKDPFYDPPAGFHHAAPERCCVPATSSWAFWAWFRRRYAPPNRCTAPPTATDSRSHRHHGAGSRRAQPQPAAARGVLSVRHRRRLVTLLPLLRAARRARAMGSLAQWEYLLMAAALAEGWVVSVPDHEGREGMGHSARAGPSGARRSARHPELRTVRTRRGQQGRSVGLLWRRLASAWAAETYADYAPELNIVGAVLARPSATSATPSCGSTAQATPACRPGDLGTGQTYPGLGRVVESMPRPRAAPRCNASNG